MPCGTARHNHTATGCKINVSCISNCLFCLHTTCLDKGPALSLTETLRVVFDTCLRRVLGDGLCRRLDLLFYTDLLRALSRGRRRCCLSIYCRLQHVLGRHTMALAEHISSPRSQEPQNFRYHFSLTRLHLRRINHLEVRGTDYTQEKKSS